ncbi:MAG: esterase-like activity of phytase family protein [Caldilinea sp.]
MSAIRHSIISFALVAAVLLTGCQSAAVTPSDASAATGTATPSPFPVIPTPAAESPVAAPVAGNPATGVIARYALPPTPLRSIEPAIANDRGILLGGIGSDLWRGPGDAPAQFWMITDRGPNGRVKVKDKDRRTFPVPDFAPAILRVATADNAITLLEVIPLSGSDGAPISGLPNLPGHDDKGYTFDGETKLPYDPSGLDPEGLVRTQQGDFWAADEYAPSLLHIAADGRVLTRYVPQGLDYAGANYPVAATLPALYARRNSNRGFEGLALSPDERTLYAVLQSPLDNPDKSVRERARLTRILAFDPATGQLLGEYAYQIEPFAAFDPRAKEQSDMKISGLVAATSNQLLVLERTDDVASVYAVDLSQATNLLGSVWDDPATTPGLEALLHPAGAGVIPLPKTLVVNLANLPGIPAKIEGLALVDAHTLAFANDNDFDLGGFDSQGINQPNGVVNEIVLVALAAALP